MSCIIVLYHDGLQAILYLKFRYVLGVLNDDVFVVVFFILDCFVCFS